MFQTSLLWAPMFCLGSIFKGIRGFGGGGRSQNYKKLILGMSCMSVFTVHLHGATVLPFDGFS